MTASAASFRLSVALVLYSVATTQTAPLLAAFRERTRPQPPTLVGVLPFSNLTGQPADDWMGVGIAETIATGLNTIDDVRAIRTDPSETETPTSTPAEVSPETTDLFRPNWIASGSYQRLGDQLRPTAQGTEAESTTIRQSVLVDGVRVDLFALQDQLVEERRLALELEVDRMPSTVAETALSPQSLSESLASPPPERIATPSQAGVPAIDGPPAPVAPATMNRDANGRATVRAVRLDVPLQLDGTLDEAVYATVQPMGDFIQQQPDAGSPASEATDAWIFYDDEAIYVAARLWESVPESQWIANEMQRDSPQLISNDGFIAVFDTFYDRRNGFAFRVNPIGGFNDIQVTDEQCCGNSDWNPVWDVRTGRFDGGWTVEMEIPFKSLRFRPGPSQVWGVQLGREMTRHFEEAYLTAVPISAGPGQYRVSAGATLTGLEVPAGNRTFEIKPYGIGSLATDRSATPPLSNEGAGDFGVDVKYGLTENLTADFTYNTDFAQVEVDEQQVNLTRFSLLFPEKREFFLEGQGIFDFGRAPGAGSSRGGSSRASAAGNVPTIFFSRRIGLNQGQTVPILGGGRLTGKVGDFSVGAISIQSDDTPDANALSTNFTVVRIKRDILRRSRVGGIFTRRSVSLVGDGSNQTYGLDSAFSFYDNLNVFGYYARSQTPGLQGDDESYQAAFSYDGDLYGLRVDHLLVGDNFNPEVGFLRRDDFRRTFVQAQYSPRPAGIAAVRQLFFGANLNYILNGAGQLETRISQARFQASLENSDSFSADIQQSYELLSEPFEIAPGVTIPVGGYQFQDFRASYRMGPQRRLSGSFSIQRGAFFGGSITEVRYSRGRLAITPQFSFEPSVSVSDITLPEGTFTATLATTRLTYTFTPRMFVGGLLQYNSTRNVLSTNVRLRWEYQPGSELFVVYNDERDTELGRSVPLLENRAFVVKFTRLFRF
jgi:TolB-like protein